MTHLRIGTRKSPLALWQAELVASRLRGVDASLTTELVEIVTSGDTDMRNFRDMPTTGVFAAELERALMSNTIDIAVHSCKDVRMTRPDDVAAQQGLELAAFLERHDPRDVICGIDLPDGATISDLAPGTRVGTSSLRRETLLRHIRPDLTIVPLRGNVQTRLDKVANGEADACVLAAAGLWRLGLESNVSIVLAADTFIPEPAQGIIAVQTRAGDVPTSVAAIDDPLARISAGIERSVATLLGGGCESPVGVHVDRSADEPMLRIFGADKPGGATATVTVALPDGEGPEAHGDRIINALRDSPLPTLVGWDGS